MSNASGERCRRCGGTRNDVSHLGISTNDHAFEPVPAAPQGAKEPCPKCGGAGHMFGVLSAGQRVPCPACCEEPPAPPVSEPAPERCSDTDGEFRCSGRVGHAGLHRMVPLEPAPGAALSRMSDENFTRHVQNITVGVDAGDLWEPDETALVAEATRARESETQLRAALETAREALREIEALRVTSREIREAVETLGPTGDRAEAIVKVSALAASAALSRIGGPR